MCENAMILGYTRSRPEREATPTTPPVVVCDCGLLLLMHILRQVLYPRYTWHVNKSGLCLQRFRFIKAM